MDSSRVVSGAIVADWALIPEMGRCGSPSARQISSMQMLLRNVDANKPKRTMVLIRRRGTRQISNHDDVKRVLGDWALANRFILREHDPSPTTSLRDQIALFRDASVVVGMQGAGLLFTAALAANSTVIEFLPRSHSNVCFVRLSYHLGHCHIVIQLENDVVDVEKVLHSLPSNHGVGLASEPENVCGDRGLAMPMHSRDGKVHVSATSNSQDEES